MKYIALLLLACTLYTVPAMASKKDRSSKPKKEKVQHGPPTSIKDVYWKLIGTDGQPVVTSGQEAYIRLVGKQHKLEGYSGCNSIAGSHTVGRHDEVKFEAISTKMACDNMKVEEYMFFALNGANRYVINGENLLLYNDKLLLAIFEAKY